jgi:acyl phosphate:glycerol-3-phosphate acyltransferase
LTGRLDAAVRSSQTEAVQAILFVTLAFIAGSIPFGVLVARRRGVDLQQQGSGNIGATNVARVLGKAPALLVLVLDGAKAAAPTYVALRYGDGSELRVATTVAATGLAAMLGHCFSPWLHWRGGKGVACALGVYLVIAPAMTALALGVFAVVLAATRVPALGSIAAMIAMAVALVWRGSPSYGGFAIATALLIVFTHRSNLRKLAGPRPG